MDGLRITDAATLDTVVAVLAGRINTRLVAALGAAGGRAVGLTGADASRRARDAGAAAHDGAARAGGSRPRGRAERRRAASLLTRSPGPRLRAGRRQHRRDARRRLLNVNADTLAAHLAGRLARAARHRRRDGRRARRRRQDDPELTLDDIDAALVAAGTATGHGRQARRLPRRARGGVARRAIVDGRGGRMLAHALGHAPRPDVDSTRAIDANKWMTKHRRPATDIDGARAQHVLQIYRRAPVVFERGEGAALFDADGRSVSRSRSPASASRRSATRIRASPRAIAEQAATLLHTSNLFFHPLQGELATRLSVALGPAARVLLQQRRGGGRGVPEVRAPLLVHAGRRRAPASSRFEHSFHGRTMGALSVTWDDHYRAPFAPLVPGVTFVRSDDPAALAAAVTDDGGDHRRADPGRRRRAADSPARGRRDRRRPAARPARCSSPTKCSAASGRTGRPFYSQRARPAARPDGARQGARRRRAGRRRAVQRARGARPRRSAITAARTAATCSPAARRSCSSRS